MKHSDEIFYSLTFGGETLSLAAALFTIKFLKKNGVCEKIDENGKYLIKEIKNIIRDTHLEHLIDIQGFPYKNFFIFKNSENYNAEIIRTFFIQELAKNNILSAGYHILSYAHNKKVLDTLLKIYKKNLKSLKLNIDNKMLLNNIKIPNPKLSARNI